MQCDQLVSGMVIGEPGIPGLAVAHAIKLMRDACAVPKLCPRCAQAFPMLPGDDLPTHWPSDDPIAYRSVFAVQECTGSGMAPLGGW